jgi:HTH-type transcriptional regulator, cell division transcriptional repressor
MEAEAEGPVIQADYSDETSTFGDRLVLAREALGLDQAQLAHRIGVKLQTLRNWEEDRSEPRANRLQMLAGMLNVSMIWLMSGEGEVPRAVNLSDGPAAGDVLAELRRIHHDQRQIAGRMSRLEKRLRAVLSQAS